MDYVTSSIMAGRIHQMITQIIAQRSRGNSTLASTTKTKLILKGLNPDRFTPTSPDDPEIIQKVALAATEMGIALR